MECLVTKLKATVDDPTLEILGEFRFSKLDVEPTVDTAYTVITTTSVCTVKIIGDEGGFYQNNTTTLISEREKELPIGQNSLWIAPNSLVSVRPKYGISDFVLAHSNVDMAGLRNISGLKSIQIFGSNVTGNINALKDTKLTYLNISVADGLTGNLEELDLSELKSIRFERIPNITGNINALKDAKLTSLVMSDLNGLTGNLGELDLSELTTITFVRVPNVTGDITACFGRSTSLNTLNIAESTLSGSINDLVSARRSAGLTTGSIKIPYAKTISAITFNGTPLSTYVQTMTANDTFTWDASGNITYSNS